jgi:hypothetical protein
MIQLWPQIGITAKKAEQLFVRVTNHTQGHKYRNTCAIFGPAFDLASPAAVLLELVHHARLHSQCFRRQWAQATDRLTHQFVALVPKQFTKGRVGIGDQQLRIGKQHGLRGLHKGFTQQQALLVLLYLQW